jgi:hypothetical protein
MSGFGYQNAGRDQSALAERSRRPRSNPRAIELASQDLIVATRSSIRSGGGHTAADPRGALAAPAVPERQRDGKDPAARHGGNYLAPPAAETLAELRNIMLKSEGVLRVPVVNPNEPRAGFLESVAEPTLAPRLVCFVPKFEANGAMLSGDIGDESVLLHE